MTFSSTAVELSTFNESMSAQTAEHRLTLTIEESLQDRTTQRSSGRHADKDCPDRLLSQRSHLSQFHGRWYVVQSVAGTVFAHSLSKVF